MGFACSEDGDGCREASHGGDAKRAQSAQVGFGKALAVKQAKALRSHLPPIQTVGTFGTTQSAATTPPQTARKVCPAFGGGSQIPCRRLAKQPLLAVGLQGFGIEARLAEVFVEASRTVSRVDLPRRDDAGRFEKLAEVRVIGQR